MNLDCKTTKVKICVGPSCTKKFSKYVYERAMAESKFLDSVLVEQTNCCGNCKKGVSVKIEKGETKKMYSFVSPIKIAQILKNLSL